MNPSVFPSPHEFRPERWLDGDPRLEQYMVSFSRGSRSCIGMKYVLFLLLSSLVFLFPSKAFPPSPALPMRVLCSFRHLLPLAPKSRLAKHATSLTAVYVCTHNRWTTDSLLFWLDSLAYCELYLTLAHLFRRYDMQLFETSKEDMEWKDTFVILRRGHLRVLLKEAED